MKKSQFFNLGNENANIIYQCSPGSIGAQLQRWELFLNKWELALMEGKEVFVMMDANIDFLKWARDDLPASDSTSKLKPLINIEFLSW